MSYKVAIGRNRMKKMLGADDHLLKNADNATLLGLAWTQAKRLTCAWEGNLSQAEQEVMAEYVTAILAELRQRDRQQTFDLFSAMELGSEDVGGAGSEPDRTD